MNYHGRYKNVSPLPKKREDFLVAVEKAVKNFPNNEFCRKVDNKQLTLIDFHQILIMIFHQTYEGPSAFALAGANLKQDQMAAKQYLITHADEEKDHWIWILDDLESTGYKGEDPRTRFPKEPCQSYIAFNFYIANREPMARLAIAAVLESIGATYGKKYATGIRDQLNLEARQISFFFGHGDTDVGHTQDIIQVLNDASLSPSQWAWMCYAAEMAGTLYTRMYNEYKFE